MSRIVGLFAKPVDEGSVKTRLTPPLTPTQAARLYEAVLADTATTIARGQAATNDAWWMFSTDPERQRAAWPRDLPAPHAWRRQEGEDLGERLAHAFDALHDGGSRSSVIVGSDHPTLPPSTCADAFHLLESADVVLGPSFDGGFYLVGWREPHPALFTGIPWSTPQVLDRTLARIRELGLRLACLPPWYDVDRPEDLRFLDRHLEALALAGGGEPSVGRRTRRMLASIRAEGVSW